MLHSKQMTPERLDSSRLKRQRARETFPKDTWAEMAFRNAQVRARRNRLLFTLTLADICTPDTCCVLGIKLDYTSKNGAGNRFAADSPSIDRVTPELGYVPDNIRTISLRANLIKKDATVEELRLILRYVESAKSITHQELPPKTTYRATGLYYVNGTYVFRYRHNGKRLTKYVPKRVQDPDEAQMWANNAYTIFMETGGWP